MTTLGPESRALITAARRAGADHDGAMTPADKARIRLKLAQRIGAGLAAGTAVATTATVAKAAPASWLTATFALIPSTAKVVGAVALSMAAGATVVDVVERVTPSEPPRPTMTVAVQAPKATRHEKVAHVQERPQTSGFEEVRSEPETRVTPSLSQPPQAKERPTAPPAVAEPGAVVDDALMRQISAIREARAAIRQGNAAQALRALDDRQVTGGGSLEQEALMVRITALCLKGDRDAAQRFAEQLMVRHPGSPYVTQLRTTCAYLPDSAP